MEEFKLPIGSYIAHYDSVIDLCLQFFFPVAASKYVSSLRLTTVVQKSVICEMAGWGDLLPQKEEVKCFLQRDENRPYQNETSMNTDPEYHLRLPS